MSSTPIALPLADEWTHERLHPNAVVLDAVQYAIDDADWSERMPVARARRQLFDALGLAAVQGYQPWFLDREGLFPAPRPVRLRYVAEIAVVPSEAAVLVEHLRRWEVTVNGIPLPAAPEPDDAAWLWDRDFRAVPAAHALVAGRNVIELRSTGQRDLEIEDVFLIGAFGVALERPAQPVVVAEPAVLRTGDWTTQGYPFYAGGMRYTQKVVVPEGVASAAVLRLPATAAACVLVRVDGGEPRWLGWQPWEADLSGLLDTGTHEVSVEVYSTLRNAFGPLHRRDADELLWVGPEEFEEGEAWTEDYVVRPYGLLERATLLFA